MKLLLLGCLLQTQPVLASKNLSTFFQASISHDDIIDGNELYTEFSLSTKWTKGINRHSNFSVRGKISTQQYKNFNNDDRNNLELQLAYNFQASNGYFSPFYSAQFKVINSQGNKNYETDKVSLTIIRRQSLSNTIELTAGFKTQKHSGTENRTINSLFLNTDFILNYQTIFYMGLNLADEEIAIKSASSNAPLPNDQFGFRESDISSHHSINDVGLNNPNASSIDSDNTSISVGLIFQLDNKNSFDFLLRKNSYKTSSTLSNSIILIDYFYKF